MKRAQHILAATRCVEVIDFFAPTRDKGVILTGLDPALVDGDVEPLRLACEELGPLSLFQLRQSSHGFYVIVFYFARAHAAAAVLRLHQWRIGRWPLQARFLRSSAESATARRMPLSWQKQVTLANHYFGATMWSTRVRRIEVLSSNAVAATVALRVLPLSRVWVTCSTATLKSQANVSQKMLMMRLKKRAVNTARGKLLSSLIIVTTQGGTKTVVMKDPRNVDIDTTDDCSWEGPL